MNAFRQDTEGSAGFWFLAVGSVGGQAACFAAKGLEMAALKVPSNAASYPHLGDDVALLRCCKRWNRAYWMR